jgi:hypothetical protein
MKRPVITVEEPARKWQHASVKIELPPGWEMNYNWGYRQAQADLHFYHDDKGNLTGIGIGLRRSIFDAVPPTAGKEQI